MTCPECGCHFERNARRQVFCCPQHGRDFYNLQTTRGTIIGPLLVTAAQERRYSGGNRALAAYARREADALISRWVVEDREAGRNAALIVASKEGRKWRVADALGRAVA